MKTLSILGVILLVTSCAFHSGTITSNVTNEPVVHKDMAVGVSSANRILGIGGLSKDALISEARKNMVRSRPLEGAEQYNNVEVNIKNTFYIIGHKTKVTVHADVIEPKESADQPSYSENYLKKIANAQPKNEFFAVGDSVIIYNSQAPTGQILGFVGEDFDRAEISYKDAKDVARTTIVSINRLYLITPEHNGLKRLDRTPDGIIVGFGLKKALIKMSIGYTTMRYPKETTSTHSEE